MHNMQTLPRRTSLGNILPALVALTIVIGLSCPPGMCQDDGRISKSKRFGSSEGSSAPAAGSGSVEYAPFAAGGSPRSKKRTGTYSPFGPGSGTGAIPGASSGDAYEPFVPGGASGTAAKPAAVATPLPAAEAPLTAPAAPLKAVPAQAFGNAAKPQDTVLPMVTPVGPKAGGGEQALQATAASINSAPAGDCGKSIGIWPYSRIPLSVYIHSVEPNVRKFKPQYPHLVTKAFEEWTAATHGVFKFRFVNQPTADITVQFVNATPIGRPGVAKNKSVNKELVRAEIMLAMDTHNNDRQILHIVEHEIGHALGLDHTTRSLGIMSPTLANSDSVFVGEGDYNELRRIYGLDEHGQPIKVEAGELDGFKKAIGTHLASRLRSMPHPLTKPCDITLTLDSAGFMYSYNVSNDLNDKAADIVSAVTRSPHYPASPTPFTGKIKMRVTIKPDFTVEKAELLK